MKLVAQFITSNEIAENVYHYSTGAAPTLLEMNNLIDAYIAWETAHGANFRNTNTALTRVTAIDLSTQTSPEVDRQVLPTISGTVASPACPNNVTIAVAHRTALRGRSFRGRTYHIGMANAMTLGNQLLIGQVAPLVAAYTLLITLGVAPVFTLGVLSRYHDQVRLNPCVWTPCTAITLENNLDSQRRRLAAHNRHN